MGNNNFIRLNENVCINKNFIIKYTLNEFSNTKKYILVLHLPDRTKYELTFNSESDRNYFILKHLDYDYTTEHISVDYKLEIYRSNFPIT